MSQIFYEDDIIRISRHAKPGCMLTEWFGMPTQQEFYHAHDKMNEILAQYKFEKALSDTRKQDMVKKEHIDYISHHYLPEFMKHGLKRVAQVTPENNLHLKLGTSYMINHHDTELEIQLFFSIQEAEKWLFDI